MPTIISKSLARGDKQQNVIVPTGAKTVGFINRGGEPTVLLQLDTTQGAGMVSRHFQLVVAAAPAAEGMEYVGSAEFAGGMMLMHCFQS